MRDTKKTNSGRLQKAVRSKAQTQTKPNSSLRVKTNSTNCRGKNYALKSKSLRQRDGANISRKRTTGSSIKGPSKDTSKRKLIIKFSLHKTDGKSSKKLSSKLQGEKVSVRSRKEGKDVDGEIKLQKRRRNRKKKRQRNNVDLDDASRLKRRTRYLLIKIKLEQNLIDAYSAEGWKGQSREKIRPEKELQRARKQILKCKLNIRDAIRQLDTLGSSCSIEDSVIAPEGSSYHEKICQKCKLPEVLPDDNIILCGGTCNRAFHQKCLDPPLDTENTPPEEHGWLCKFCVCKMEILEATNAHLGTHFSLHSTWQDIFKEEAARPDDDAALANPEEEWPSDDSEDDDYNPDRREDCCNINIEGSDDNASDDSGSSTSICSSDGECSLIDESVNHEYSSINGCKYSDDSEEKVCGRRQRKAVDYLQLYDEMFGKDAGACEQVSEDEDWGPAKRKRREKESDAVNTLMALHECQDRSPSNECNNIKRHDSSGTQIKRPCFRFPRDAVERLRQVFAENELPPRSTKVALSKELGLDAEKVNKWFKNARYMSLKTRKQCGEGSDQLQSFASKEQTTLHNMEKAEVLKSKASKSTKTDSRKNAKVISDRKKRQPEITQPRKDLEEFSDDVCLKKLLKDRKRKVKFAFQGDNHAAEFEFERLSKLKTKIDSMKHKLTAILNSRVNGSVESHSNEISIIYVPTAVLREKVE